MRRLGPSHKIIISIERVVAPRDEESRGVER